MLRPAGWMLGFLLSVPLAAQTAPSLADGRARLKRRDFAGAVKVLEAVTEREPRNAQAWLLLGRARHRAKKLEAALEAHDKAAEFAATRPAALFAAGRVSAELGEVDDAFDYFGEAKKAGFAKWGLLQADPAIARLRSDARLGAYLPPLLRGDDLFVEKPRIIHAWDGENAGDQFGWVARCVGDLDGDGVTDFATSSPSWRAAGGRPAGRVYVYSSRSGKLLFHRDGAPGQRLGNSIAPAGDIDGDGTPDIVVGAPGNPQSAGQAFVFSGRGGKALLTLTANEIGDNFGLKVCGVGDFDGDGRDDLLVGATKSDAKALDAGRVTIFSGRSGKALATLDGETAGDNFGSSADSTMDDEHRLIVIGAMNAGEGNRGRVYVYRHAKGRTQLVFTIDTDETGKNLGQYFVSIIGDVDSDGVPDVYASDFANAAKGPHTGRVFVHSGASGKRLLTLTGARAGEGFGTSPSQAGDVDGDGRADLIIGAWQNAEAARSAGKCYLRSGKDGAVLATYTCRQAQDTFGFDAQGIGDVDGDGVIDFLLTSAWSPVHGPRTGRVFIVAGPERFRRRSK